MERNRKTFAALCISVGVLHFLCSTIIMAGQNDAVVTFGIVPQQSASTLARTWSPVLLYLEGQTGYKFVFRTATDIPTFEQRLADGEYDIAYMNPYHYTVFSRSPGYKALAKARDKKIKGVIVVRKDSSISSLMELQGKTLAFPAPAAFAATVLPQAHLNQNNIPFTPKYVSSHDSVYRAVASGIYPAGGGVMRTLQSVDPAVREYLKVLWTTPGYTSHAIAAHPRVPADLVNKITNALVKIGKTEETTSIVETLKVKGFEKAEDSTWNDVRALNITIPTGVKH